MKQLILPVALIVSAFATNAQAPAKTEGAHQSEYNAKQNEVDGERGPSKRLPDARDVSASNEASTASNLNTEENTMAPVSESQAALDGTGNMPQATLNVAGSPIPGSSKRVVEMKPASKSTVPPASVRPETSLPEKRSADLKGKKKKKR